MSITERAMMDCRPDVPNDMRTRRREETKRLAYSLAQTAEITSLSLRKINAMIADGRLKSVKVDGRRLVYASSVEALLPDEVTS